MEDDKVIDEDEFFASLVDLLPGISIERYQEILNSFFDISSLSKNIEKISQSLLLNAIPAIVNQDTLGDRSSRGDYIDNTLFDAFGKTSHYSAAEIFGWQITLVFFMIIFYALSVVGGLLGWSQEYIVTVWYNFLANNIKDLPHSYDWCIWDWYHWLINNFIRPSYDYLYTHILSLRTMITSIVGSDIDNLSELITRVEELEKQDNSLRNLIQMAYDHSNTNTDTKLTILDQQTIIPMLNRISELEQKEGFDPTEIIEELKANSENIETLTDLLVAPITNFYDYKENNQQLYQQELKVFSDIFKDVIEFGYLSIEKDIRDNLEKIIYKEALL